MTIGYCPVHVAVQRLRSCSASLSSSEACDRRRKRHVACQIGIDRKGRLFRPNEDVRRRLVYHETDVISTVCVLLRLFLPLIGDDCTGWVPERLEMPDSALHAVVLHFEVRHQMSESEKQLLLYSWMVR
jgi:hypothetical protein